jgi:prefoldin subunit 5
VASPQPRPPSRRLLDAAHAEHLAIEAELQRLRDRRDVLQHELRVLDARVGELRRRRRLVGELAGDHQPRPNLKIVPLLADTEPPRQVLRGAEIRRTAGRLVAQSDDPHRPLHYTKWFQLVLRSGYAVAGRDPLATFLTQLNRSPVVRRDAEAGTYRLDYEVVPALEKQLLDLHNELARLHNGQQTIDEIASARERRDELTTAIAHVERQLHEAAETFHGA